MKWLELSVQVPAEFVEPITLLFSRYGRAMSIEDVGYGQYVMRTYLTTRAKERRARIEVGVKLIGGIRPIGDLNVQDIRSTNWEETWKQHFSLLKVGKSLIVRPPWISDNTVSGKHVIEIDPGLAFGTGHHPTTFMCLELLEELIVPGFRMLDLGTGSGILSVAGAKLGASEIIALDLDPNVMKVARQSLKANNVKEIIRLGKGSLPHALVPERSFDLVVANISAKVIQDCSIDIFNCLKQGGLLVASGFLDVQRSEVLTHLGKAGFVLGNQRSVEDWVTLVLTKEER